MCRELDTQVRHANIFALELPASELQFIWKFLRSRIFACTGNAPKKQKKKRTKNEGGIQRSVEMEAFSGQRLHCMKMAMEWGKSWGKAGELRPTDGNQFAGCRK